ncbi:protein serine/threonine phosphatase 2C family protein [Patescibacteria group bacterium]|nr:protein serine/threonine phosphatase 2C family protein [Patescibacteria group bacterium]
MKLNQAIISETGQRRYMEDAHFLDLNFNKKDWIFGGVYDGHGGEKVAEYLAANLHLMFLKGLPVFSSPEKTFIKIYEEISEKLKDNDCGACTANFFIKDQKIFFANVGDARIVIISKKSIHQLTTDHRIDNPLEKKRIEKMGGYIVYPYTRRGSMGLMPTRTIGDEYFKPIGIITTPSVGRYKISKDDLFLIAATDGLFDVMKNEEVAKLSRKFNNSDELAQALKKEILINRYGSDNLTIMVLKLFS